MSEQGLQAATEAMRADGAGADAIEVFAHFYRDLEAGATGLIGEETIEPVPELPRLDDLEVDEEAAHEAFARTAVIKLNGGLGTSMGMDRAKSLLPVKGGLSFLDIIVRQVLALRSEHRVTLPLIFMNSFRTRDDTRAVLANYPELAVGGLPVDFLQNREPKLLVDDLSPVSWPADPDLEWCPPGHADLYPALRSSGVLDALIEQGYRYAFCSNSDNLGATADPRIAGWLAANELPFVIESCRRTQADRKGGHLALRRSDGRLVLRETAQTSSEDMASLQDLERHRYCNTNNLWLDLRRLREVLDASDGVLDLPLIVNTKTVDPSDATSPKVIQIESAMGAAVQVFEGARSVHVERSRFVPVKTTNDLLVLRSDVYEVDESSRVQVSPQRESGDVPFVDLDPTYFKLMPDFEQRFAEGPPSLVGAQRFIVKGDVRFAGGVIATGEVEVTGNADGSQKVVTGV
ncbi:MAG: putative uridylyltransferase [Pseudonocardiales bacterium]|nr:putative uridylyltransferase [Pseudonocardiales bacterium]